MKIIPAENRSPTEVTRRSKGEESRAAILLAAAQLATTRGLEGLSIGDLAAHLGMSKSGLYAHFKSKEELELATIEAAFAILEREVPQPALAAPPGKQRLLALVDAFLSHLERRVFPGGCFFAAVAAELDTRPGRARDRVLAVLNQWFELLTQCLVEAQARREIERGADVQQGVFEVEAMLVAANSLFVMTGDRKLLEQARRGVDHVLLRLGGQSATKKKAVARKNA